MKLPTALCSIRHTPVWSNVLGGVTLHLTPQGAPQTQPPSTYAPYPLWPCKVPVVDDLRTKEGTAGSLSIIGWSAQRSNHFTLMTFCNVQYIYRAGKKSPFSHARPFISTIIQILKHFFS
jgi:hypothetical protein